MPSKVVAEYQTFEKVGGRPLDTPRLKLYIHGAEHRRMDIRVFAPYREALRKAVIAAGVLPPIVTNIDLEVLFVDPTSPDLDNLICALFRALDSYEKRGQNIGIMKDDSLIQTVKMSKMVHPRDRGTRKK